MKPGLGAFMTTEKLTAILRAKSPFSNEEIAAMSETDSWRWDARDVLSEHMGKVHAPKNRPLLRL